MSATVRLSMRTLTRTLPLPGHERGIVHRFRRDAQHVLDTLIALDPASAGRVIKDGL